MKSIYLREANSEKMKHNAEVGYIQRMQQFADKDEPFTFSLFKETGRLHSVKDFKLTYDKEVPKGCNNVMVYFGGEHIFLLPSGKWKIAESEEEVSTNNIEELELKLYLKTNSN